MLKINGKINEYRCRKHAAGRIEILAAAVAIFTRRHARVA
jgi:hypothetical protein